MMPYIITSESEKHSPHKPTERADDKELFNAQVTESEDITEIIFWKPGYEKQQEYKESSLMMQQVIIPFHRLFFHKFICKRPSEISRKAKSHQRTYCQTYGRQDNSEELTIKKSANEPCDLSGYR